MSEKKVFTWQSLKEFCGKLPESELAKPVQWWGEEHSGIIESASLLEEDYVLTDYGHEPASVQEYEEGDEPYDISLPKGTPILNVD